MLRLDVLICTFGSEGLSRCKAMTLPHLSGVRYVISCQDPDGEARKARQDAWAERPDVRVVFFNDRGLSLNRNHALDLAEAEFVLIADDDIVYTAESLTSVLEILKAHPDLDIFAFRFTGADSKVYPPAEHPLDRPYKGYYYTSIELAFRLKSLQDCDLRFDEHFGIGSGLFSAAEEGVLVHQALRKGLKGKFFPIDIAHHPGATTGTRLGTDPGVLRAKGAYFALTKSPLIALLHLPVEAHRVPSPFTHAFRHLWWGYRYVLTHKNEFRR